MYILLDQDIKQPENGYEGNPIKIHEWKSESSEEKEKSNNISI